MGALPEKMLGKTWSTQQGSIDSADLQRVFDAIAEGRTPASAIPGVTSGSDRRANRAVQLLKDAGLIHYDREEHLWVLGA